MKISYNWLRHYCQTNIPAEQIADLLTSCGLEVEGIEKTESIKGGLTGVVIGKVLTCEPHPDSDHLHLTTVDVGGETPLAIVCGAPNVAKDQKVPVATIGTKIWTSETEYFEIKKSKLRGYPSFGMICSAKELGLSNDHDGILVLDNDAVVGTPAKEYFHITEDYTIEISITANRSDATSHIGVARDLIAVLNARNNETLSLSIPSVASFSEGTRAPLAIEIADHTECPRYAGICLDNVEVKDSPQWLRNCLTAVGIRPINNVVDITNFVLMETGHPLHAFDMGTMPAAKITVQHLPKGTLFTTLDGEERKLNGNELMICSGNTPMGIAGVFGGKDSGITTDTTSVFIESAYFNPVSIRKTAKFHGLNTDASFRFERGTDPNIVLFALKRAVLLMQEYANATVSSKIADIYPNPIAKAEVSFSLDHMQNLIGREIPPQKVKQILHDLEIEIKSEKGQVWELSVPTNKVDVTRECDVVEEILRIYGYENIPLPDQMRSSLSFAQKPDPENLQNLIADYLADNGFREIMNNSLTPEAYYENNTDFPKENSVTILNALSKDLGVMRQTLLYGGLETLQYNINRKQQNLKLFEFGNIYQRKADKDPLAPVEQLYSEEKHLMIMLTGNTSSKTWEHPTQSVNFFQAKSIALNILQKLRINTDSLAVNSPSETYFEEGLSWCLKKNGENILSVGKLSEITTKAFDIRQEVFYADLHWTKLLNVMPRKDIQYSEISKFPEVKRDLALVLNTDITFADVEKTAWKTEKKLLQRIELFDAYQGENLEAGKKSYAISFFLQDVEKTLTEKQINKVMDNLIRAFENNLGATLRQ